ncbi:hypothetical protein CP533_2358 [Ophiocordyceps camponoti-saundersi (nom. inval.)]|nr:hypothetical protein CP533_2358 [Ophiocordyceps camponoti-saundersi (nom. inval.)]
MLINPASERRVSAVLKEKSHENMPPVEIADSDEEDGSDSLSTPENYDPVTVSAQTRSSDRTSHATASTDPVLFQRVFDEQREAAHQSALNEQQQQEAHYQTDSERCEWLIPVASIESLAQPDAWSSSKPGERSTTKTRKKEGAAMVETKDMWDVPSSPERNSGSSTSKTKSRQATTIKITRGLRRNVEMLGYESDEDASRTKRDTKRRKLQSSNEDDLNTPIKDKSPKPATVSTMTMDDQHPLYIATKPLSASQKEEYESIHGSQSNKLAKEAADSKRRQCSSGTATNVNTPRTNDPSSHNEGGTTQTKRRTRARRDSSPDIIALDRGGDGVKGYEASSRADDAEMPPCRDELVDDDESDFGESLIKPKKKRGRPAKKSVASDTSKTKRGRPKKKKVEEQMEEEEAVDLSEASPPPPPPPLLPPAAATPPSPSTSPPKEEQVTEQDDPPPPTSKASEESSPPKKETKKLDSAPAEKTAPSPTTPQPKPQPQPQPLSRNKPLYRVGLSKRLRIEPLLKSLPK